MLRSMRFAVVMVLVAGCGGSTARRSEPITDEAVMDNLRPVPCVTASARELSPALAPLSWWLGTWRGETEEHWVAAGGALFGIDFDRDGGFDVMIVDDGDGPGRPDGKLRLIVMPGGHDAIEFSLREIGERSATFANDHRDPSTISFRSEGDMRYLAATVAGTGKPDSIRWSCDHDASDAPVLEEVDRAFALETAKHGVEGWLAAFAPNGGMLHGGKRIEGEAAIREAMSPLLTSGRLAWAPIASGVAASGNLGFTVGKATFTGTAPDDHWRSSYVTIWQSRNDGPWKAVFDTGRIINE